MSHVVPVLCLIAVVFFLEMKLGKEIRRVDNQLQELIKEIRENKNDIIKNKDSIRKNKEVIDYIIEHGEYM